jgi:hypothetical protein
MYNNFGIDHSTVLFGTDIIAKIPQKWNPTKSAYLIANYLVEKHKHPLIQNRLSREN